MIGQELLSAGVSAAVAGVGGLLIRALSRAESARKQQHQEVIEELWRIKRILVRKYPEEAEHLLRPPQRSRS